MALPTGEWVKFDGSGDAPMPYSEYDVIIRAHFPNKAHTFSKLTSLLLAHNNEPDASLNMRCWNKEIKGCYYEQGTEKAKELQNLFLSLQVRHDNFIPALRQQLANHAFYIRYVHSDY